MKMIPAILVVSAAAVTLGACAPGGGGPRTSLYEQQPMTRTYQETTIQRQQPFADTTVQQWQQPFDSRTTTTRTTRIIQY